MDFHNVYHKVKKYRLEDHGLLDCNMFDPIDPLRKSFPDIKERLGGYSLQNVCTYFKVKVTSGRGSHEAMWDAMGLKKFMKRTGDMQLGKAWVKKNTFSNSLFIEDSEVESD